MSKIVIFILFLLYSFQSLSLDVEKTIESTITSNAKVKIGLEKLNESKELIEKSTGAKLPTVTSTISGTYSKSELETSTSTTTPETFTDKYKITVTQNLYDAGFNDLEITRSKILYDNEIINFQLTIQDLILDAINGYLTVINYQKSLEATKKNFESVSKALEEIKTKFTLGSSTLYDLQSAESSYAIANANLYSAERNYEISKKTFLRIAGIKPVNLEDIINIESNLSFINILKSSHKNNLNLKILNNNIENNKILLLKEKKSKQPSLDITGSAEYADAGRVDPGTETTNGSIALTLTIPLYQQGIDNSNIRKYYSAIIQSELNYEDYKNDIEIQLSNAFKDYNISKVNMESNLTVIQASETALKSLNEEYEIGTKTITDLVDEESKLLQANVNFLNSKKDFLVNYFVIKSLDGSLINHFQKYLPDLN